MTVKMLVEIGRQNICHLFIIMGMNSYLLLCYGMNLKRCERCEILRVDFDLNNFQQKMKGWQRHIMALFI